MSDDPPPAVGTAVTWEERSWAVDDTDMAMTSRRARLRARGPYLAAVTHPIEHLQLGLPAEVVAEAEDALMAITRFDAELAAGFPGTGTAGRVGEIAPLAAVLLRTESASSSQIEDLTAGAGALALATLHLKTGQNARQVAANVDAMRRAVDVSDRMDLGSILAAHAVLMDGHRYALPGRLRDVQVWIGGTAPSPHTAAFVPPHADRVAAAMDDLVAYCRRTDVPVLPHVAVAHAQFETIHPFADGNGRTGRVLVQAMLHRAGATRSMTVPVSAGLLTDTAAYFEALVAHRDGDPVPIVRRFSHAAFAAVANGRRLAEDLGAIHTRWRDALVARRGAAAWTMLPMLFAQPAVTVAHVMEQAGVSQPAAQRAIDRLVDAGALVPAGTNRRNRVWLAPEVIDALDAFAERAGRRP